MVINTPPHLKYVATLPCNLSLIACFMTLMFHKVVWQHMQRVVGLLLTRVDVIGRFCRVGTGAEYETSRRTIGRDDSYPVLGRSEP